MTACQSFLIVKLVFVSLLIFTGRIRASYVSPTQQSRDYYEFADHLFLRHLQGGDNDENVTDIAAGDDINIGLNLTGDIVYLTVGGIDVTQEMTEAFCMEIYLVLATCLEEECPNVVEVCPTALLEPSNDNNNNDVAETAEDDESSTTCASIERSVCETYGEGDCCLNSCALELQLLALCIQDATSVDSESLECNIPACHVPQDNALTQTNLECSRNRTQNVFTCVHRSNLTSNNDNNSNNRNDIKTIESFLTCPYTEDAPQVDLLASDECICESRLTSLPLSSDTTTSTAATTTTTTQMCSCQKCDQSDSEFVALDCSADTNSMFVIDNCVARSCSGDCIRNNEEIILPASTPTEAPDNMLDPTTLEPTIVQPSSEPTKMTTSSRPTRAPKPTLASRATEGPTTEPTVEFAASPTSDPFTIPVPSSSISNNTLTSDNSNQSNTNEPSSLAISDENITHAPSLNSTFNKTSSGEDNANRTKETEMNESKRDPLISPDNSLPATFIGAFLALALLLLLLYVTKISK